MTTLRDYISESGLFLEGAEMTPQPYMPDAYCGFNVSKTKNEPIDQIVPFILAKRIQEWNEKRFGRSGTFIVFIAGLFEVLNTNTLDDANKLILINSQKEISKKYLFNEIANKLSIKQKTILTRKIWMDQKYWNILYKLLKSDVFSRGNLIKDTLKFYSSKNQLMKAIKVKELPENICNLPLQFLKEIGNWPAPILYTPSEVAESLYLQNTKNVSIKIGQAQEKVYDKYLLGKMDTFRYRQPTDLLSKNTNPRTVTPYIDKEKEKSQLRIYFSDTKKSIGNKLAKIKTEEYVFTTDKGFGEVLNPIVEKAIYAIEWERIVNQSPTFIGSVSLKNGKECIDSILTGKVSVKKIAKVLPLLLDKNILKIGKEL